MLPFANKRWPVFGFNQIAKKGDARMRDWMPIATWLPRYQRSWLLRDIIAGATVWAVLVPLGLAYAGIVGVNPVVGLYTLPLALLAYAIFGGSRLLAVGPDAAVAVLSGSIVAAYALGDEVLAMTIAMALIVGVLFVVFYFLKLGWIADLLPDPVLKGFIEGVVWVTILKQLPPLLGLEFESAPKGFLPQVIAVVQALPQVHVPTAVAGIGSVIALLLIRRFAPRLPGPLFILVASIALIGLFGLDQAGIAVLGQVSGGLAAIGLPSGIDIRQLITLVPGALAIVVLGYTKSMGALKRAAEHSGEQIDPDRELLAIGVSNIGAGLGGGYAVAGSLTATAVNIDSGGKTQVGNIFAGILGLLTILFLLPVFASLAYSSLAAIVVVAIAGLSDLGYFRRLWSIRRYEVGIGMVTFVGVLAFDVSTGVTIGVVMALFTLAHHIHDPTTAIVGRTQSGGFVDIDDHPEAEEIPGMLIWHQYAPLVFLNARILSNKLRRLVLGRKDIRVVLLDATASSGIDSSAASAFIAVSHDLAAEGIVLWVSNVRDDSWELIVAAMTAAGAEIPRSFDSVTDAVEHYEKYGADGSAVSD
jgi:high affinity sulfate transporter 1